MIHALQHLSRLACLIPALAASAGEVASRAPAAPEPASPISAYFYFVHGIADSRIDLALSQFAEDAQVQAGPGCTRDAPCIGKAAIRSKYLAALLAGRAVLPLRDQRFDGETLRTHGETLVPGMPLTGVTRLRGGHVFEFRAGLIRALWVELDSSDAQTALYMAHLSKLGANAADRTIAEVVVP